MHPLTRQSRHPVMIGQMVGVGAVSAWQMLTGPGRHLTVWHAPAGTYLGLALVTLIGCMAVLAAAIQSDSWTAAAFELFGSVLLVTVLGIDLYSVLTTMPFPDTDIVTGLIGGLLVGILGRIVGISKDAIFVVKEQRAPPVGDLDLMAVGRVDSATALVVGSESLGAHAAEIKNAEGKHELG